MRAEVGRRVAVIGAGGHAKVVIATLRAAGHEVAAVVDDDETKQGTSLWGLPVFTGLVAFFEREALPAVIAIGNNDQRRVVAGRLSGVTWLSAIHPDASVHSSVQVGEGTVVFAGAVIQPDTRLGRHVIVNTSASIDHDCSIGNFAHLAPGCHLAGEVGIGDGALIGIGSVVTPGQNIGAGATVGAGAAVASDVAPSTIVCGVPARVLDRSHHDD